MPRPQQRQLLGKPIGESCGDHHLLLENSTDRWPFAIYAMQLSPTLVVTVGRVVSTLRIGLAASGAKESHGDLVQEVRRVLSDERRAVAIAGLTISSRRRRISGIRWTKFGFEFDPKSAMYAGNSSPPAASPVNRPRIRSSIVAIKPSEVVRNHFNRHSPNAAEILTISRARAGTRATAAPYPMESSPTDWRGPVCSSV